MKCYIIEEGGKFKYCIEDFEEQYRQTMIDAYYEPYGNRLIRPYELYDAAAITDMKVIAENYARLSMDLLTGSKEGWVKALMTFALKCNENNISWSLTGSATDAIRGAKIIPHDLDIYVHTRDFYVIKQLFMDYLLEPFQDLQDTWVVKYFGRLCINGVMLDIASDEKRNSENYYYDEVIWNGTNIRMEPFESRYNTEILRDRKDRIKALEEVAVIN
jgi:hypothetical protein